jgi:O-succinylhomoserine sulfhydrylase
MTESASAENRLEPVADAGSEANAKPGLGALSSATTAARGGWVPDFSTRPSAPPLYLTTAFDIDSLSQLDDVAAHRIPGYIYTRDGNPNQDAFASDVATLEGAAAGVAFASGMGALTGTLLALVRSGDQLIVAEGLYGRTIQLLNHFAAMYGIEIRLVKSHDLSAVSAAVTDRTRLAIIESLSNPLVEVCDIAGWVQALGSVPLLVDNTFATPCLCRPLQFGAQLVWHSASKYLNGHGDVMLGVMVGATPLVRRIQSVSAMVGVNSNPMESWLGSRGLRTLPLRMARVSATAFELACRLRRHPAVNTVRYPGLPTQASHTLARQYLGGGFGGMLSFEINGGRAGVDRLFQRLAPAIPFSPTLADARTTVSYPAGTSHKFLTATARAAVGISDGLVRLSVGLEDVEDLWRELSAALDEQAVNPPQR